VTDNRIKEYLKNRFSFRGASILGVLNTITAAISNRVLVRHVDDEGKTIRFSIKRGTDFRIIK